VVQCAHSCLYIKGKRDDYTNGTAIYTHEQLILLASNKYNLLVQEGIFGAKSLEEEKIIAMQAELTALKGQFVLAPSLQGATGNKKDGEKKDSVKKDQPKGKKKKKKNTENKKKQKKMEKWQRVPSKDGESHEKKHDNRTYYWCSHHMVWGNHSSKDCRMGQDHTKEQNEGRNTYAALAAAPTVGESQWAHLLANMHRNLADE
jgi:hypothetical protein